jgi:hypothetical protein
VGRTHGQGRGGPSYAGYVYLRRLRRWTVPMWAPRTMDSLYDDVDASTSDGEDGNLPGAPDGGNSEHAVH